MADEDRGDDFVPSGDEGEDTTKDTGADKGADKDTGTKDEADKGSDDADKSKGGEDKGADDGADKKAADDKGDGKAVDKKFEKKSTDNKAIPKARVDQMLAAERERARVAEARAAELEKSVQAVNKDTDAKKLEEEITALEKKHSKAMIDGKDEEAAAIAGQIRLKEREVQIQLSKGMSAQAKEEAREEIRLDLIIERLQEQYPELDENHADFDQDLTDLVLATQRQLVETQKMSLSSALTAATKKVMDKFKPAKADKEEEADGEDDKKNGLDKAKLDDRTKAQIDKNLDTVKKTPPDTKGAGVDSDKKGITGPVDVTKLSQTEFNALPETTKERLRGDTL